MQTLTELLTNGTIVRTPLLGAGQTLNNLPHGLYNVTGGVIEVGYLGNGTVTKVTGIFVNNTPFPFNGVYVAGNQPFNTNFACVLYEMKQAGISHVSKSNLDHLIAGRTASMNNDFVQSYRASVGQGVGKPSFGEAPITNNLINGIAR